MSEPMHSDALLAALRHGDEYHQAAADEIDRLLAQAKGDEEAMHEVLGMIAYEAPITAQRLKVRLAARSKP